MKRIGLALAFCLNASAISGLLLLQHHGEPGAVSTVNEACGDGQQSGCDDVARSSWSKFAGFPVAAYGLIFYLSLALALALAALAVGELRASVSALVAVALVAGLLVDLFLLGVQIVAIRAYCWLCVVTYVLGALALVALSPFRRSLRVLGAEASRPEGRLAFGAWLLGTATLAAAVAAANTTLTHRAAERQASLLGPPAAASPETPSPPVPSPAPLRSAEPAADQSDLAYWRERAERLQQTLDDPRKLEAYFAEKAQAEFDAEPVAALDLDGTPARGPADAPVKVVEYSDFLCPFCRNLGLALAQFVPQAGGRVVVHFKNYPLDASCNPKLRRSSHPGACNLALGAVCAERQGKFEAYHDHVFSSQELRDLQPAEVVRIAGEAGLDIAAMQACLADEGAKATLAAEIAEANRLGVSSTPTIYINGRKLSRINDFVAIIDKEAQKKGFAPLTTK